jgi:general secretion pathway protein D
METINRFFLIIFAVFGIAYSNCDMELFNINASKGIKISEVLEQVSNECSYTIIVKDKKAKEILETRLNKLKLKQATVFDVLDVILKENDLAYDLKNNILKISYIITKTYHIDYVTSKRSNEAITDASQDTGQSGSAQSASSARDISKIESKDEFDFWENIEKEIYEILNRPEDSYEAPKPIINAKAGLITVSGTFPQIKRIEDYLKKIEKRLHNEVLIDVSIVAVELNENYSKGIDWSKFGAYIKGDDTDSEVFSISSEYSGKNFSRLYGATTTRTIINSGITLSGILDFLKTNGEVKVLSNPKILTLNNQPALISIGETIHYNVPTEITINENGALGTQSYTPSSVFVGILLNITPEITDNNYIILRINPSISEIKDQESLKIKEDQKFREIAPDTKEKKISSVVKIKDGSTIILGGLITNTKNLTYKGVPILKDLPIIGYAFKNKKDISTRVELVFIIKAKIVSNDKKSISLKELGYKNIEKK